MLLLARLSTISCLTGSLWLLQRYRAALLTSLALPLNTCDCEQKQLSDSSCSRS